jgi:Protein of unknown function (DUF1524)
MLRDRISRFSTIRFQAEIDDLFADDKRKGFYDLPGLEFLLFEYEDHLRKAAKSTAAKIEWKDFRGAKKSVEHIYPQTPEVTQWPLFNAFSPQEKRFLTHSLGNLVAVSIAKNAALSRRSFKEKKKGTKNIPGFSKGSFSELSIAQYEDWTPNDILSRGLEDAITKLSAVLATKRAMVNAAVRQALLAGRTALAAALTTIEEALITLGSSLTTPIIIPKSVLENIRKTLFGDVPIA